MFDTFRLTRNITYQQLFQLLRDLGFQEQRVGDLRYVFEHPDNGSYFLFPIPEPDEPAPAHQVGGVRRSLDLRGHLQTNEFDAWLEKEGVNLTNTKVG